MTKRELVAVWTVVFFWATGALLEFTGFLWFGFSGWIGRESDSITTCMTVLEIFAGIVGFVLSTRGYLPGTGPDK